MGKEAWKVQGLLRGLRLAAYPETTLSLLGQAPTPLPFFPGGELHPLSLLEDKGS